MTVANNTRAYYTANLLFPGAGQPTPSNSGVEWIVEAPGIGGGGGSPLAHFCPITFTNCSATLFGVTGPINDNAWTDFSIIMARSDIMATPSPLSADGSSFSVTWESAT